MKLLNLHKNLSLFQKILISIIASFLLGLLIEACIFNFTALRNGNNSVQVAKTDSNVTFSEKGEFNVYTVSLTSPVYAQKAMIQLEGNGNPFDYKIFGTALSNYGEEQKFSKIEDTYYPQLSSSCISLNKNVKELTLKIPKSADATLSTITLKTTFQLNPYRIFFVFVCFFLLLFLTFCKEVFERNLAIGFGTIGILLGLCMILFMGTETPGWDEQAHFQASYLEVFGSYTSSTALMRDLTVPAFHTYEERTEVSSYLRSLSTDFPTVSIDKFVTYNHRAYLGQSAFLLMGRILHLPADWFYMFGKLGNLLVYILLIAISIRIAKIGKIYIAAIGLLPTALFLSSTYTYDSFITGFLILGFVFWLNEMITPNEKAAWWKMLLMILCFCIGSFSKAIYIPLLLLIVLLPKEKFNSRKQMIAFKLGIVLICLVVMSTFILPALETSANAAASGPGGSGGLGSDDRGGATDIAGQMSVIFNHPIQYTKLLLSSIFSTFGNYVFKDASAFFAHAGYIPAPLLFVPAILLCWLAFIRPKSENTFVFSRFQHTFIGVLLFGIVCLIWTSMYLAFTPVGDFVINGVQGRYYIPLLVPLLYLLRNHKIQWNIAEATYNRIICSILALLSLSGIYCNLLINCI